MASSKRQTTMAKIAREQAVRERRARKQEKKDHKKLVAEAHIANAAEAGSGTGTEAETETEVDETATD